MSGRFWPLATLILGLATLAVAAGFELLPAVRAAYSDGDFTIALGEFQRAWDVSDLVRVFGDPPDAAKLAAMNAGDTLDLYGFIPAYTLFLAAAAAMLAQGLRRPLAWCALAPLLVAVAGDVYETTAQLRIGADYANAARYLPLAPACWTKFFGLGAHALGMSAICFLRAEKGWTLGALGFVPIAGVFAAWAGVMGQGWMTMGFALYWLALIAAGVQGLLRKPA